MKEHVREEASIVAAAERQMRGWILNEEQQERSLKRRPTEEVQPSILPYVTISREAGAGGSEVGRLLGAKLGWEVFDRNLLDHIAERFHADRQMLELVDETESSWVYDVLGTWMDRRIIPHEKYVVHLSRAIVSVAQCTHGIFVGRGAQFLLPRQRGLNVRLIASEAFRLARLMRDNGWDAFTAKRRMAEIDRGRAEFVARFFHRDVNDPHLYDLVINVDGFGTARAAEQIAAMAESLQGHPLPVLH
jgi:cytidylate kinase